MNRLHSMRARVTSFAASLTLLFAAPAAARASTISVSTVDSAAPSIAPSVARASVLPLTQRDVDASNAKVKMAYTELVSMWSSEFQQHGARFEAPRLLRYRGEVMTPCGEMSPSNAFYCPNANAIYFDDIFVAAQARSAGQELGTDGDMVAVGIIAHEMGHAVAAEVGFAPRDSYENEATADCLAGAFAQHAEQQGELEKGDLEEAFYGMAAAGDPTPQPTGNPRYDRRVRAVLARNAHGTRDQRMQNFRTGLEGGAGACLEPFAGR